MQDLAYELNLESERLARAACDEVTDANPGRPRFVVGALGPTTAPHRSHPTSTTQARNVTFEHLVEAYLEQARGLVPMYSPSRRLRRPLP